MHLSTLASIVFIIALVGCAPGRKIVTPGDLSSPTAALTTDQAFEIALKAMKEMGSIERVDKEQGLIFGATPSGIIMEIEIVQTPGKAPQVQVQAQFPPGMEGMGNITEPDRYLTIYRRLESEK